MSEFVVTTEIEIEFVNFPISSDKIELEINTEISLVHDYIIDCLEISGFQLC
jgi:hypothetical protein